jgi:hypothetical protein
LKYFIKATAQFLKLRKLKKDVQLLMMKQHSLFLISLAVLTVVAFNALVVTASFACGDDDERVAQQQQTP